MKHQVPALAPALASLPCLPAPLDNSGSEILILTGGKEDVNNSLFIIVGKAPHPEKSREHIIQYILGIVFGKMKETTEACISQKVTETVISVSACFNSAQRSAVIEGCQCGWRGSRLSSIINNPNIAIVACVCDEKSKYGTAGESYITVYGLGGGCSGRTFYVPLLSVNGGGLPTAGDIHLGGKYVHILVR